ncbi:HK97-gp10 family putative phage morphogenesis protein [Rummeliibacillus sp. JY-2-4R]
MSITRVGNRTLEKALQKWGKSIENDVKRIVHETAMIIQNEARARAPVDSGYLRQSITYVMDIDNQGISAMITVGADWAVYVEFGTGIHAVAGNGRKDGWVYYDERHGKFVFTRGMQPQPFWFPALEIGRKYFIKEMKKLGA